ncbi:hypothetical protein Tco_1533031, partial [Tanacetum coccineum]
ALSKLLQLGTIEDYQREFEKLMNWFMDIPDSLLISYFFSGLKLNLQHEFFVSRPTTLGDVFSLARIIEARFEDERTTTTIANPNDINIAVPDQVLEESTLHTSDKVEVVPTSMVATYDEHGESGDGEHDDAIESGNISILNSLVGQDKGRGTHAFTDHRVYAVGSRLGVGGFWHVIPACGKLFEVRSGSEGFTVDEVEQTPKPKGVVGRPRKKQRVDNINGVDVVQRGPVRDEGRGAGGSGDASGSRGRGTAGSRGRASGSTGRGAGGSKRKPVSTAGTQKRQGKKKVGTSGFAKWFGLQDEPEQSQDELEKTQAEPQQTQHEPEQTQVEGQVEQTEDQAEIDLTQVEQTQEQTQEQMQPQEQPQQAALRMPSARILQRKLGKQGSSQNTALNLD